MKTITRSLLFLLCLFRIHQIHAQAPEQDCINGIRVCNNFYSQPNSYVGGGPIPNELSAINQGCLGAGERNDVWYIVNVSSSGNLQMTITPNNLANDYDFAVWDITGVGCDAIFNYTTLTPNAYPPIACNFSGTPGQTGISSTITGAQWVTTPINVTPGMTLAINVSNYSNSQNGYTLDFGPSTASIYDTVKPKFLRVKSECQFTGSALTVTMTEPVNCNSIDANGSQFYITPGSTNVIAAAGATCTGTGPNRFTTNINLNLSAILPPGTYWLHSKPGTTGTSIADGCGNNQSSTTSQDSIQFTLFPNDPPKPIRVDTPACVSARIHYDRSIKSGTVAADGSDFLVTGPGPVSVVRAVPLDTTAAGMADSVDIFFNGSIVTPGTYTINVRVGSDGNAITDSCRLVVYVPITFVVSDRGYVTSSVTPSILCEPGYVQLSASLTVPEQAVRPGFTWVTSAYVADSSLANTTAYVPASRTFQVQIKDTFGCYRRHESPVIVSVRHPQLLSKDTAMCIYDYITLHVRGGDRYLWYPAAGLSCTNCPDPIASPLVTTNYSVVIFDQYGCSDTLHQLVTVNPLPVVTATPDTTIIYGTALQLYVRALGGKFYYWDPIAGVNNANIPNPIVTPRVTTRYVVHVTDTNQCRITDTVNITVRTDVPVSVPSGFTPNGDGRNDIFRVINLSFQRIVEFRVMNRWGQEVFSANDNRGWDGTWNGREADLGTYKYLIRVAYPTGVTQTFKGDVTLIR